MSLVLNRGFICTNPFGQRTDWLPGPSVGLPQQVVTVIEAAVLPTQQPHGSVYYNGFVYVGHRDNANPDITRIQYDDYTVMAQITPATAGITDMIRVGTDLWVSSNDGNIYQVSIPLFALTNTYVISGVTSVQCLKCDGTYIYCGLGDGSIGSINLATGAIAVNATGAGVLHGMVESGDYLYFADTTLPGLRMARKADLALVSAVTLPGTLTDDLAQDDDCVYGAYENIGTVYRFTKGNIASGSSVPITTPYSGSYGVFYIDGYILSLDFRNGRICILDRTPALLCCKRILGIEAYPEVNELCDDGVNLHITTYTFPLARIIRLNKAQVLNIVKPSTGRLICHH